MSTLTDTHVIDTLDRYNLLRLGEDPTPDRDLKEWEIYPYDIANSGTSDNDVATNTETRTYRPNWERIRRQITSQKRDLLPPVTDVDALAWYLPIHFYGPEWGIYVKEDAIEMLAGHIYDRLPAPTGSMRETEQLLQAAAWVLYLHEAFHHKAESFAIRLEIARLQPVYIPYFTNVYRAARGTDHQVEEIVATNEMYRRLQEPTYRKKLGPEIYNATRRLLSEWIPSLGPSYRLGTSFGADRRLNKLCSQISEGIQHPIQPQTDWNVVPQMTRGLFSKDAVVYVLVPQPPRSVSEVSSGAGLVVLKEDIHRLLTRHAGYTARPNEGKGGHTKYVHERKPMVIVPSKRELSPAVIRSTKQSLGYRSTRELADAARGA